MTKTPQKPRAKLREIWSFTVVFGRWSLFVGFGEVQRT